MICARLYLKIANLFAHVAKKHYLCAINRIGISMRKKFFFALLGVCALVGVQNIWAAQSFSIEVSGNTFIITRTDTSYVQVVNYHTVSLSALEGKHFTKKSGQLTFGRGEAEQRVSVTETPITSVEETYRYQNASSRHYRLDVTDLNGYLLASSEERLLSYGDNYKFISPNTSKSVTDLVYFDSNGSQKSAMGSLKFVDIKYKNNHDSVVVTDGGYKQAVHTVSLNNLYSGINVTRDYLDNLGYKVYATVFFSQKEKDDGYQYIQILADNSSTFDKNSNGGDPNGDIDTTKFDYSIYRAAFILSYSPSGSTMKDWHKQFFPHRYNYVDNSTASAAGVTHLEFDYYNAHLYKQAFQNSSYKATTSGSLVLSPSVNALNIRFDAAGSGDDTWYFKDLTVRAAFCDSNKPTVQSSAITVTDGPYAIGAPVQISVPFNEIVTISGTPTLTTTWGTFTYLSGTNSNVLTFTGTVNTVPNTQLIVQSFNGTIMDLAGSSVSSSINKSLTKVSTTNILNETNLSFSVADTVTDDLINHPAISKLVYWKGNTKATLVEGTDYELVYTDCDQQGTATVKLVGKGNYSGSISRHFYIRFFGRQDFKIASDSVIEISKIEDLRRMMIWSHRGIERTNKFRQVNGIAHYLVTLVPIGSEEHPFACEYDGNGYKLYGINLTGEENVGLFAVLDSGAVVKDLKLSNCTMSGVSNVGVIAGRSAGSIVNCLVDSTCSVIPAGTAELYSNFGGVVGQLQQYGTVRGCLSAATVDHQNKNSEYFGGIVGLIPGTNTRANAGYNLYAGTHVSATQHAGAIFGTCGASTLEHYVLANIYLNDTLPGGVDGMDRDTKAGKGYEITLDEYTNVITSSQIYYNVSGLTSLYQTIKWQDRLYCAANSRFVVTYNARKGYNFIGYTCASSLGEDNKNTSTSAEFTMPAADCYVYTRWELAEYTITYDLDEGQLPEGQTNPATYTVLSDTIRLVNPTRAGYRFLGWRLNGATSFYQSIVIPTGSTGDRTYTAKWMSIHYSIIYDLAGGELPNGQTNPTSYTINETSFTLVNPVREGYTFIGWTGTDLDLLTMEVVIPRGSLGDREYEAHWQLREYTITYDLAGGQLPEGKTNPTSYTIETEPFTLVDPVREGYTFIGWTGNYMYGYGLRNFSIDPINWLADLELVANWDTLVPVLGSMASREWQEYKGIIDGTDYNMNSSNSLEKCLSLLDKNDSTKWCVVRSNMMDDFEECVVSFSMDSAISLVGYQLTTGNDVENNPSRNPTYWVLYGRADESEAWTQIDEKYDQHLPAVNSSRVTFGCDRPGKYKYFRFNIYDIVDREPDTEEGYPGYWVMELGELWLLTALEDSVYTVPGHDAACYVNGQADSWFSNEAYFLDSQCTQPTTFDQLTTTYEPTITRIEPRIATIMQDGYTDTVWVNECTGLYADSLCTTPATSDLIIEGGVRIDPTEAYYDIRIMQDRPERTVYVEPFFVEEHPFLLLMNYGMGVDDAGTWTLNLVAPQGYVFNMYSIHVDLRESGASVAFYDGAIEQDELLFVAEGEHLYNDLVTTETNQLSILLKVQYPSDWDFFNGTIYLTKLHEVPTGIENSQMTNDPWQKANKILIDGCLYIERNGHLFSAQGQLVR